MQKGKHLFTSESVSAGHPDKLCDQISDGVLDAIYEKDPRARVAVECLVKTGFVVVAGEVTTSTYVDIPAVAREVIKKAGYDSPKYGFDGNTCGVLVAISGQSPDISQGVTEGEGLYKEQGAGDQGLMFGFATNETPELMPLPIVLAHKLLLELNQLRKKGTINYLGPDAKSQVTIEYQDGIPKRADTILISSQHDAGTPYEKIREDIISKLMKPLCAQWIDDKTKFLVNPTGSFVVGGPVADCGVTGRKIIVDTYGGHGSHGGGAFSGKDPSKVDRSGAYAARYIAKNVVAAGLADKCEVQVAYAIGVAEPVSILVNCFGTNRIPEDKLVELVRNHFPLKPADIIRHLDLRRPIYRKTAAYGHFGRNEPEFTWEKTDKAELLKSEAGPLHKPEHPGSQVPLDG